MTAPLDENGNLSLAYVAELQEKARGPVMGEIKRLAGLETNAQRAVYLEKVLERRGRAEYERLRKAVWEYMRANGVQPEPLQEGLFACR